MSYRPPQDPYQPNPAGSGNSRTYPSSQYPQDLFQQDESRGGITYRAGSDNSGTFPSSRSLQPVQGSDPPWTTRSVSTARPTATGKAQFSGSHGPVPNWESPPSAQYNNPPYTSTQSQFYPSSQEPTYLPPDYPPGGAPPNRGSGHDRTYLSHPQQPTPYDTPPAQTQYRGSPYQGRQQDYPQRTPQQQYSRSRSTMVRGVDATSLGENASGEYRAMPGEKNRQQPAGSGYSYSRRVEVVRSHTITSESVTYGGANDAAVGGSYQSGDYPRADYKSLGSQPIEDPGSVTGGGGGSGG
ncbi:hypothetical protein BC827DRAFT_186798 [Russula dissimulans]|nr:hypothetical protein BC827DRAFT_186798 [Russula dissimulans]